MNLYFDNCATSFPKPSAVAEAMNRHLNETGGTYGRSAYPRILQSTRLVEECRDQLATLTDLYPVVINADGRPMLCALPASYRVDLEKLREQIHAREVSLVDETMMRDIFPDCEIGAEPPIGKLFGLPTVMDKSLIADEQVTFQAGSHTMAVTMSMIDYQRVAQPQIAAFGRHM